MLPKPTVGELLRSTRGFKPATCRPDGVYPQHFGMIGEHGLEALSEMLWLCELVGTMPDDVSCLGISMYDKPEGGYRTIGNYRALISVW